MNHWNITCTSYTLAVERPPHSMQEQQYYYYCYYRGIEWDRWMARKYLVRSGHRNEAKSFDWKILDRLEWLCADTQKKAIRQEQKEEKKSFLALISFIHFTSFDQLYILSIKFLFSLFCSDIRFRCAVLTAELCVRIRAFSCLFTFRFCTSATSIVVVVVVAFYINIYMPFPFGN